MVALLRADPMELEHHNFKVQLCWVLSRAGWIRVMPTHDRHIAVFLLGYEHQCNVVTEWLETEEWQEVPARKPPKEEGSEPGEWWWDNDGWSEEEEGAGKKWCQVLGKLTVLWIQPKISKHSSWTLKLVHGWHSGLKKLWCASLWIGNGYRLIYESPFLSISRQFTTIQWNSRNKHPRTHFPSSWKSLLKQELIP